MRNPAAASKAARAAMPTKIASSSAKTGGTRTPCCVKVGLKRGPWMPEEDELLANYINKEGEGRWRTLPKLAGLLRCGKSCRLRWMNYLRPSVKRGQIAPDEEDLILRLHSLLGNRWSLIAGRIPGRTDNEIKNYWNTHLSKKLIGQGIDPRTHKPLNPDHCPATAGHADVNNKYMNNMNMKKAAAGGGAVSSTTKSNQSNPSPGTPTCVSGSEEEEAPNNNIIINTGNGGVGGINNEEEEEEDIDVLSSFLNSLMNEDPFGAGQQHHHHHLQQQQPVMQKNGGMINDDVHATEPSLSSSDFGWESAVLMSSAAFIQNDPHHRVLLNHYQIME